MDLHEPELPVAHDGGCGSFAIAVAVLLEAAPALGGSEWRTEILGIEFRRKSDFPFGSVVVESARSPFTLFVWALGLQ